ARRVGYGVWHLQERRHTTECARHRTRPEIFFMCQTWITEMHMVIDDAREQVQTARINYAIRFRIRRRIHGRDTPIFDQYIGDSRSRGSNCRTPADQCTHTLLTRPVGAPRKPKPTSSRLRGKYPIPARASNDLPRPTFHVKPSDK